MQFIVLIMINIVMFVIFYLLISLKLERKATEFREKRLRRIMEEMINEFNETAERNISILENKIQTMRRLLKISGEFAPLDLRVSDDGEALHNNSKDAKRTSQENASANLPQTSSDKEIVHVGEFFRSIIRDGTNAVVKTFTHLVKNSKTHVISSKEERSGGRHNAEFDKKTILTDRQKFCENGEEESLTLNENLVLESQKDLNSKSDEEKIRLLFLSSTDKYALIGDLYAKGYTIEFISRCSGIPVGEVRLVLNLSYGMS
ncbi:MAG: hypothetical protein N2316_05135 [Spirochaetes bacterium]|nr:hypothetical protein [Spirochaetota bacterium]